ncbi:peptide chain release factor N(5)-glutamine methyltransferase [Lysobacter sp. MMG2]|uniref:peptide chain release factor N(5)-glutamine methyltransferase n=1 Tax=Lysobacter sp. MMG2 TaxID=2801338 RepID=UPI001C232472|nr:peptide chain release factor N(5)-glutamine methyltransferase [Lysobacter sp. MMG2]MBU8975409.1 peptide chain release factor N(5)-glutamine methyltransferase [Lysobacter sp. MMG2]
MDDASEFRPSQTAATVGALLAAATRQLPGDEARAEAERLLGHALGVGSTWLYTHRDDVPAAVETADFERLLERRLAGEPVAYLLGRRGFWRFDLQVTPATLIPRPETERLVELALERLPADRPLRVADLGTGTGAIALAIAHERPMATVIATDASADALEVARANAQSLGLAGVEFREGDWLAPLTGESFDLIASNPPYIAEDDAHLSQGDLRFEPRAALASGADGLDDIRRIAAGALAHLRPGGWLLVEHGWDQGAAVRAVFEAAGLEAVQTEQDWERRDRVTLGCLTDRRDPTAGTPSV